ncbi:MAG TPA: tRNA-dihydrouridine synthase [Candidatus Woesebacteria bacterium]|nr:tRNA-dihydrouridine synthase [Candidatus Woesebacteria bacterium]
MTLKQLISSQEIVALSPMDGITDAAFRLTQCQIAKPDIIFTEFVSAEGLAHNAVKLYDTLLYSSIEHPIVGQLFGKDPHSFYIAAVILCHLGFDGVDINFGCPAKTVTQHGSGASLIEKPQLASQIIKQVQRAVMDFSQNKISLKDLRLKEKVLKAIKRNQRYSGVETRLIASLQNINKKIIPTVSVKTRLGIDSDSSQTWIPFLLEHNLDFLTLHGRTLKQAYTGHADWEAISKCVEVAHKSKTPFFGNGDVTSHSQALQYCQKYGVNGVLIGRAAMGNPWLFIDKKANFKEKYEAMLLHAKNFENIFPSRRFDSLRRHFLFYISGHPNAKKLRQQIVSLTDIDGLLSLESAITSC